MHKKKKKRPAKNGGLMGTHMYSSAPFSANKTAKHVPSHTFRLLTVHAYTITHANTRANKQKRLTASPSTRATLAPHGKQNSPSPCTKLPSPFPRPEPAALPSPCGNPEITSGSCPHAWRGCDPARVEGLKPITANSMNVCIERGQGRYGW